MGEFGEREFFFVFLICLGPAKLNGVSLRRVNQIYVIATSTKLDLSAAKFENLDDKFFKRVRPAKKDAEKDIFDSKKEVNFSVKDLTSYVFKCAGAKTCNLSEYNSSHGWKPAIPKKLEPIPKVSSFFKLCNERFEEV
jgi:ribosomal protein L14E/L6E/L27E